MRVRCLRHENTRRDFTRRFPESLENQQLYEQSTYQPLDTATFVNLQALASIRYSELLNFRMDDALEDQPESQSIAQETPVENVFIPPSINRARILSGESYTHHSAIPTAVASNPQDDCVLGVDEAGRGPVLGGNSFPNCGGLEADHDRSDGLCSVLSPTSAAQIVTGR
jgi:ribonuclease H2 subunit A